MIDIQHYLQRREVLSRRLKGGVAIVPTAPERMRNRDSDYPYRFDSYFYYLTGFGEPESVFVLVGGKNPRAILFCREKNPERELWDGVRCGPRAARKTYGFDETWPIETLDEKLPQLLANKDSVYYPTGMDASWDTRVIGWVNQVRGQARSGVSAPGDIRDIRVILDEMRLIKDDHEIGVMRRAAAISAAAHCRAMQATRPGRMEFEIEAELLHEFRRNGSQFPAYSSIVAGGANACILHYRENNARLKRGVILLIDAGCELDGYASDITRSFPVDGRFSKAQREIYELVLAAQAAVELKVNQALDAGAIPIVIGQNSPCGSFAIAKPISERTKGAVGMVSLDTHWDSGTLDALTSDPRIAGSASWKHKTYELLKNFKEKNLVEIGERGMLENKDIVRRYLKAGAHFYPMWKVRTELGIEGLVKELRHAYEGTEAVYAHFDMDVLGGAGPAPGDILGELAEPIGMTDYEVIRIAHEVGKRGLTGFSFICIPPGSAVVYRTIVYVIAYLMAGLVFGRMNAKKKR